MFEVIDSSAQNFDEFKLLEASYIQQYNTLAPNGYNLLAYDDNNRIVSEETGLRMTIKIQNRKKIGMRQFKGVAPTKFGKYQCRVQYRSKLVVKNFNDIVLAAEAYDKAVLFLYPNGEVSLNFPEKKSDYLGQNLQKEFEDNFKKKSSIYHSKYHGVILVTKNGTWRIKKIKGSFRREKDAAKAYDYIQVHQNKTSKLNFPELLDFYKSLDFDKFLKETQNPYKSPIR